MPKSYYPINLDIENKLCVVIGGGDVAERKVKTLLQFGGKVSVISPRFMPGLMLLSKAKKIKLIKQKYNKGGIKGAILVIAATNNRKLNRAIYKDATKAHILVNIVDNPKLCSFIAPAIVKRGSLVVSISTSGQAPAFAKALRIKLEDIIPPQFAKLTEELGNLRRKKRAA
ncbi:bifunctional precorrin-2 dehydrogenase/sirohydrochlorin ferrochelatase [Candidatus Saganbacteria bacterium]|nr:bifunctional precorrin-2 dehydrogenase/sirohydrochlorin ferrochelatase [Candidatus Saganbacteria bacterium]